MTVVESTGDWDEALAQSRALIFLWVDWSMQARFSELALRALLKLWDAEMVGCPVAVYRVNLSSQTGEVWQSVRAWLAAQGQPADLLTISGNGALLWVRRGSVLRAIPTVALADRPQFWTTSRTLCDREPE